MLQMQAEMAAQRTQGEASEKYVKDQSKIMSVFRAMAKGDIVPVSDEKKLMEYSSELYKSAKMTQSLALQAERIKHKSQWDGKEHVFYGIDRGIEEDGVFILECFGGADEVDYGTHVEVDLSGNPALAEVIRENLGEELEVTGLSG